MKKLICFLLCICMFLQSVCYGSIVETVPKYSYPSEDEIREKYDLKQFISSDYSDYIFDLVQPDDFDIKELIIYGGNQGNIRYANWNMLKPYHQKVFKKFQKNWKPVFMSKKPNESIYMECELVVNRNGEIVECDVNVPNDKNTPEIIAYIKENNIERSISKAIVDIGQLPKLPRKYEGDTIKVRLVFIYKYYLPEKKNSITIDSEGYPNLVITHKKMPYYTTKIRKVFSNVGGVLLCIAAIPVMILIFWYENSPAYNPNGSLIGH